MSNKPVSSANELQNKNNFDHVNFIVDHEEDEPLNCHLVDGGQGVVVIGRVVAGSLLEDKLQVGDYILSVNGRTVVNKEELFKMADRAFPQLTLVVARKKSLPSQSQQQDQEQNSQKSKTSDNSSKKKTKKTASGRKSQSLSEKSQKSEKSASKSVKKQTPVAPPTPETVPSTSSTSTDPKQMAASLGIAVKSDREYLLVSINTTKSGKPVGLGIMRIAKENIVIASSVQKESVSFDQFMAGDRFLTINNTKVADAKQCQQLILQCKGDFQALVERPPNGLKTYGIQQKSSAPPPLKSSYTQPIPSEPEQTLGDPLCNYETAPADVQNFILRQLPILMRAFGTGSCRSSQRERAIQPTDRLKIEHDVQEHPIESDVAPGSILKKPPKRT